MAAVTRKAQMTAGALAWTAEMKSSNAVTAAIEQAQYSEALEELERLRTRILTKCKVRLPSNKENEQSQATLRHRKAKAAQNYAVSAEQSNESVLDPAIVCFPVKDPSATTCVMLVVACQMNTLRCWVALKNRGILRHVEGGLVQSPGCMMDWLHALEKVNPSVRHDQIAQLANLLLRMTELAPTSERQATTILSLNKLIAKLYTMTKLATAPKLCDIVLRGVTSYERTSYCSSHTAMDYLNSCNNLLLKRWPDIATEPKYTLVVEYWAHMARKAGQYMEAITILNKITQTAPPPSKSLSAVSFPLGALTDCYRKMIIAIATMEQCLENNEVNPEEPLKSCLRGLRLANGAVRNMHEKILDEHITRQILKILRSTKDMQTASDKCMVQLVDDPDNPFNVSFTHCHALVHDNFCELTFLLTSLVNAMDPSDQKHKLTLMAYELFFYLSTLTFNKSKSDSHKLTYKYLEQSIEACQSIQHWAGIVAIAHQLYRYGCIMLKSKMHETSLVPIRRACNLLLEIREKQRTTTEWTQGDDYSLVKRLEVLSRCQSSIELQEDSAKSVVQALLVLPTNNSNGIRAEVVQRYVEQHLHCQDDRGWRYMSLATVLAERRSELTDNTVDYASTVEAEFDALSAAGCNHVVLLPIIDVLCDNWPIDYPIHRARALVRSVKLRLRMTDLTQDDLVSTQLDELLHLCKQQELGHDVQLSDYRLDILATAYSLKAIHAYRIDQDGADAFALALQSWKLAMKGVTPYSASQGKRLKNTIAAEEHLLKHFQSITETFHHILCMANYFAILRQPIFQIQACRLLMRLCSVMPSSDMQATDACNICLQLASAFLLLGYTGEAGVALGDCRAIFDATIISQSDGPSSTMIAYHIVYATYLTHIGNVKKSRQILSDIDWVRVKQLRQTNNTNVNLVHSRRSLMAAACYAYGMLHIRQGKLSHALYDMTSCLSQLHKEAKHVLESSRSNVQETSQLSKETYTSLFFGMQWSLVHRFLITMERLCELYITGGFFSEATFFAKQGLQIAEAARSPTSIAQFNTLRGQIHCLQHQWQPSRLCLTTALDALQTVDSQLLCDVSFTQIRSADLYIWQQDYNGAQQQLVDAETVLNELKSPEYLARLHDTSLSSAALSTPRAQKLLQDSASSARHIKSPKASIKMERCALVPVESDLVCRKAILLLEQKSHQEAEKLLRQLEDVELPIMPEIEYSLCFARAIAQGLMTDLGKHPVLSMLFDSVYIFTDNQPSPSKKNLSKGMEPLLTTLASASQYVRQVLGGMGVSCSPPIALGKASRLESFLHMCLYVAARVAGTTRFLVNNSGGVDALVERLDASNAVSALREHTLVVLDRVEQQQWPPSWWTDKCEDTKHNLTKNESIANIMIPMQKLRIDEANDLNDSDSIDVETLHETNTTLPERIAIKLPADWIVCCVTVDPERNDVYISRIEPQQSQSMLVRLPMQRKCARNGSVSGGMRYDTLMEQWTQIKAENDTSIKSGKECTRKEQKATWWSIRQDLDGQLKRLLDDVETKWLGAFKGLLSNVRYEQYIVTTFKTEFEALLGGLIKPAIDTRSSARNGTGSAVKLPSLPDVVCCAFMAIADDISTDNVEDIVYFTLDLYQFHGVVLDYEALDFDHITKDVQNFLHIFSTTATRVNNDGETTKALSTRYSHVLLVLDKYIQNIPLESIPILRHMATTRIPSLSFLYHRLTQQQQPWICDKDKTSYVLNASGDLTSTQQTFSETLAAQSTWTGIVGRAPSIDEYKTALVDHNVFLYFSHGGGEMYMPGHQIRRLPHCAVTLLMGCSSGKLMCAGEFEPYGMALDYMVNGCRSLVANLWDVTDRDIDRFSLATMEGWGLLTTTTTKGSDSVSEEPKKSLAEAVTEARDACFLKYLIGAAPVVYGIPVYLK